MALAVAIVGAAVATLVAVFWRPGPGSPKSSGSPSPVAGPEPAPPSPPAALGVPPRPPAPGESPRPDAAGPPPGHAAAKPKLAPEQLARLNEAVLMARLRDVAGSDPTQAVQLAREGNRRFSDSPDAPERESILIHALAALDLPSEARGQAEAMVNHYPDSAWVREIEAFTGAHRHRNLRFNDAGQIEYEH